MNDKPKTPWGTRAWSMMDCILIALFIVCLYGALKGYGDEGTLQATCKGIANALGNVGVGAVLTIVFVFVFFVE